MKTLKVLKVEQPIGEFYIGAIDYDDLLEISTVDIREFEAGNPDSIDGLQRDLSKSRLKSLRDYVNLEYATFPTSVLLAINEKSVDLVTVEGCEGLYHLVIRDFAGDEEVGPIPLEQAAFVIDGQHRLAGLQSRDPTKGPFEVNVSIFVGADIADQAEIFSRVNLAQTKVNKSLTYDLLDYSKEKSPFKVAHDITVALNRDPRGPFYHKIKRLGKRTPGLDGERLAQATVVNGLLRHLPPSQELERTKSLFGLGSQREPRESWKDRIFVDFYRDDDVLSMLKIVTNYFRSVSARWPEAWSSEEEGVILSKTTGYNALIRFLKDAYLSLVSDQPRVVEEAEFSDLFEKVDIPEESFTRDNYLPGSTGASRLYNQLMTQALGATADQ
jgi:DGQHR domain-containing protein